MGVQHSKGRTHPSSNSTSNSQANMSTTREMADGDMSDVSVELGEPYDRIDYPPEVYDRVCGRKPPKDQPLAKKNMEVLLSDTQSSHNSFDKSEVSPKRRKRKKKELYGDDLVPSTGSSNKSTKTGRKSSRQSLKRRKKEDSEDESSDDLYTDEDDEYSEVDSSPEKKGKKKRSTKSKMQEVQKTREDKMKEKKRAKIGKTSEEKEKIELPKNKHDKSEETHSIRTDKKERKDVKNEKRDKCEDNEERVEKHKSKQEDHKDSKKKEQNKDKIEPTKINEDMGEKSQSIQDRREEKKELESNKKKVESTDPRRSSFGKKKKRDSSEEPPPAPPAPPPTPRKKKPRPPAKTNSSDDSMLPSCMLQLFKDSSVSAASPSTSLSSFRVPKKKDTSDDRLTSKKQLGKSDVVLTPEERGDGGPGWDPRSMAIVPPQRRFGKPPMKQPMEKKRLSDTHNQQEGLIPRRPSLLGPYPGWNAEEEERQSREWIGSGLINFEDWRQNMDFDAMESAVPSTSSLHSSNQQSTGGESSSISLSEKRLDQSGTGPSFTSHSMEKMRRKSIDDTPSSSRSKRSDGVERSATPRDCSSSSLPTPRWTGERENDPRQRKVHFASAWSALHSTPIESTEKEDNGWNEFTPPVGDDDHHHSSMNTSVSPPLPPPPPIAPLHPHRAKSSLPASRRLVFEPLPKPPSIDSHLIPYRLHSIDDAYLPPWNRSDRFKKKYRSMAVAGPFPDHMDKKVFERMMKEWGTEVAWTEAPPTRDAVTVLEGRTIGVIFCQTEAEAKEIALKKSIKVQRSHISVGIPLEVLLKVEGVITKTIDKNELIEEMTDVIESNFGELVELILFPPSDDFFVEGKARFFYTVHGTRAIHGAPLPLGRGREITFSVCPREKSTTWIKELYSDPICDEETLKKLSIPAPRIIPFTPCYEPQPVPPPSLVSLSTRIGPIKTEPGTSLPMTTTVSTSSTASQSSSRGEEMPMDLPGPSYRGSTRFSRLSNAGDFMAIPPPGLVVTPMLLTPKMEVMCETTFSIPSISVPAGVIPMPPRQIPPPMGFVPILPFPDLPSIERQFFVAPPPPRRRKSGGAESGGLLTIDPATFIRPFGALLPKQEEMEDEILLYARPEKKEEETQEKIDWDAVRAYFKDEDCSSRVYGGVVSLRFTGEKAKEKAQLLMINSPHTVNGQRFSIGLTFSVVYEASRAVAKTRLYDEIMEKFGSVIEVEKKCDAPSGKPVYKIYFDSLEKAQSAAIEGITVGESTLENIGGIPT